MLMRLVLGQVVHEGPVAEMGVDDRSRLLERVEGPVDGGLIDRVGQPVRDRLGSEVLVVVRGDDLTHRTTGSGHPQSGVSQPANQVLGGHVHRIGGYGITGTR